MSITFNKEVIMPRKKKKVDTPTELVDKFVKTLNTDVVIPLNKSEWLTGTFEKVVTITNISQKHMMEIEMTDDNGNVIIWYGRNYDTNKIKLNNRLKIVGRAKQHIEENGVKKTLIKYFTY